MDIPVPHRKMNGWNLKTTARKEKGQSAFQDSIIFEFRKLSFGVPPLPEEEKVCTLKMLPNNKIPVFEQTLLEKISTWSFRAKQGQNRYLPHVGPRSNRGKIKHPKNHNVGPGCSYKWSYNAENKWVTGVISPYLWELCHPNSNCIRGPPTLHPMQVF